MKIPVKIALCSITPVLAVVLSLQKCATSRPPSPKENTALRAASETPPPPLPPDAETYSPATPDPDAAAPSEESEATGRMYAAHAVLREPGVADPDSAANREILQAMVMKALRRKAAEAPAGGLGMPRNPGPSQQTINDKK